MKKLLVRVLCIVMAVMLLLCTAGCSFDESGNLIIGSTQGNVQNGEQGGQESGNEGGSNTNNQSGSNTNSNSSGGGSTTTTTNEKYWPKVNKVAKPSVSSGTMTMADFEKIYRPYTDWRIYEIRTTQNAIKPTGSGKAYYISNNGKNTNDGLSPNSPLKDYAGAAAKGLKSGDVLYFQRGGTWRGRIEIKTPGITITAYGEGKAPQFFASPESGDVKGNWTQTDTKNVYEYKTRFGTDIGAIIFDNQYYTYKSEYTKESVSGSKSIRYVNSYKDLKEDLQLFHDPKTFKVYVYSKNGNPADRFSSIEFNISSSVFGITVDNLTFDGICVKFTGAHGIASGTCKGLTVRNCEFGWIGGGKQGGINATARYGNAIEIWGGAVNYTVENNYIYQIYDAGATFQYTSNTNNQIYENIKFNNNVIENCNYSIEYFVTTPGNSKIKDFQIDGNLMWYAGDGLCSQRDDRSGSNHIKSWGHNNNLANQIKITNNLFAIGVRQLSETLDKTGLGGAYDKNIYVQTANKNVAINGKMTSFFKMDDSVKQNIESKLGDKNAVIIKIKK